MNSNLSLAVVSALLILLLGEVEAPRGRTKSESPPKMRRRESPAELPKSVGQEPEMSWDRNAPRVTFDDWMNARKVKTLEKGRQPWVPPTVLPKPTDRIRLNPPPVQRFEKPVAVPPEENYWKGLTKVHVDCRNLQITSRMANDECLKGYTKSASHRCAQLVYELNSLPPEYRTEECQRITEGECRKTWHTEAGEDIYQCTCFPYEDGPDACSNCCSPKLVDRSNMIVFKFCPKKPF